MSNIAAQYFHIENTNNEKMLDIFLTGLPPPPPKNSDHPPPALNPYAGYYSIVGLASARVVGFLPEGFLVTISADDFVFRVRLDFTIPLFSNVNFYYCKIRRNSRKSDCKETEDNRIYL